ncbi:MAG: dTDP-4-dehydrorhamnose reductase [uncultured Chloroflexia bacterium]|uniref:dTDP-4-dehydrorhamnose reductase n=1 Tax=uncultured Chloroflexia bacterium TaxID=1672391 RepID=A0A6J4JT85_9CHLR|nr:MAG: dTDP-4-dehydrorhamnose reductase [uncultured Chloroflexia bacterium]
MKVAVIGSTGQLGQDLMRVFGEEAVGFAHEDLDVTDEESVVSAIRSLEPDWVLNTAAFHRVDDCETNPTLTFAVNATGALNVARAAAAVGSGVAFFSSDYVFGGEDRERGRPYEEGDTPHPLSVYGVSKVAGEQLVMQTNPRHLVVRSAGLYGTATSRKGWTFPELMLNKARAEGAIRVVTDQVLSPTFTEDLARKTKELIEQDAVGLFHLTNAGECTWFEFARGALELAGVDAKMEQISTEQMNQRARRPPYSALDTTRLETLGLSPMRPWEEALNDYLRAKGMI